MTVMPLYPMLLVYCFISVALFFLLHDHCIIRIGLRPQMHIYYGICLIEMNLVYEMKSNSVTLMWVDVSQLILNMDPFATN